MIDAPTGPLSAGFPTRISTGIDPPIR